MTTAAVPVELMAVAFSRQRGIVTTARPAWRSTQG
jgi:hypothetical protein